MQAVESVAETVDTSKIIGSLFTTQELLMICHFSCGATSAIATALALKEDPSAEIIYADTGAEHPDNWRFLEDCERVLFKKKVTVLKSDKFKNLYDMLEKKNHISFFNGAECTGVLKRNVIQEYLGDRLVMEEHVYGYDTGELPRIERFKANNEEIKLRLPLIEHNLSHANCLALLQKFEIEIPTMYKLGYKHSNCIGCVKARDNLGYWQAIKEDFPDIFEWMAKHERRVGAIDEKTGQPKGFAINRVTRNGERRRLYLDEFDDTIKAKRDLEIACGYSCGNVAEVLGAGRSEPQEERREIDSIFGWLTGGQDA